MKGKFDYFWSLKNHFFPLINNNVVLLLKFGALSLLTSTESKKLKKIIIINLINILSILENIYILYPDYSNIIARSILLLTNYSWTILFNIDSIYYEYLKLLIDWH